MHDAQIMIAGECNLRFVLHFMSRRCNRVAGVCAGLLNSRAMFAHDAISRTVLQHTIGAFMRLDTRTLCNR